MKKFANISVGQRFPEPDARIWHRRIDDHESENTGLVCGPHRKDMSGIIRGVIPYVARPAMESGSTNMLDARGYLNR